MHLVNTEDWTYDQIAAHGAEITAGLKAYADTFPDEVTVHGLFEDIISGAFNLWLVMEGDDVRCVVLTKIEQSTHTGMKKLQVVAMGGTEGVIATPMIDQIEAFAKDRGCKKMHIFARKGWGRILRKHGYDGEYAVVEKAL